MQTNLKIFNSTIDDGNMNTNPKFYKEGMTKDQIKRDFYLRRLILGRELGFNGAKILIPSQKSFPDIKNKSEQEQRTLLEKYYFKDYYYNGKYIRINKELIEGYNDLYDIDLQADILVIDKDLPGVALAYPVADCPVVFAEDMKNKVVAMAHCGGEYIDRELPAQLIDALRETTDSKVSNIRVIVGPHAQEENFTYDCVPRFIRHEENWNDCLREDNNGMLHINMSKAIVNQLVKRNVNLHNINISKIDTITDSRFYSNNRARFDKEKAGIFYTGCIYLEDKPKQKTI